MADLITRDQYKDYKGIEHFKDDSKIDSLLSPISELVKTYCGTSFIDYYSSNKPEIFDIMDAQTAELFLTESPLVSVSSVKEREGITADYITLVNNTSGKVNASTIIFLTGTASDCNEAFSSPDITLWSIVSLILLSS